MTAPARLPHDWFPRPLPGNVAIGERSWCYSAFAFIHCRSRRRRAVQIGNDTGVYHGSFFELGPRAEVEIGDFCTLVGAVIATNRRVVISDYAFIAHEVVLADGFAPVPPEEEADAGRGEDLPPEPGMVLGENVWIGARATLLGPVRIGEGAVIGAGAVVDADVPAYAIVAGNPARVVGSARGRGR